MKTAKEILEAVKGQISDPSKWTQGVNAKNKFGGFVDPKSSAACCHCTFGAYWLHKNTDKPVYQLDLDLSYNSEMQADCKALVTLTNHMDGNIGKFNDTHNHAEVLERINNAINSL